MDPAKRREICSKGGKAAHALGKAHKFTSAEGSAAVAIAHHRGTAHYFTSKEARAAGRKGGLARAAGRKGAAARNAAKREGEA